MSTSKQNYDQLVDAAGNYTIAKGEKGDPGVQGVAGSNGAKGSKGTAGATGAVGDKGDTGVAGAAGAAGAKGQKGSAAQLLAFEGIKANIADLPASGNSVGDVWHVTTTNKFYGWNGSSWGEIGNGGVAVKGQKGLAGVDGIKGQKGTAALKGQKGGDGATGAKGQKGEKGESIKGQKGLEGAAASKGNKGEPGTNGTNGTDGADGDKGQKGASGTNGPTGATGDKGAKGNPGAGGSKGLKGEIGVGQQGNQGPQGDKGQKGLAGTAAAKGDIGPKGQKGDQGDAGIDGNTGQKGQKGIEGGNKGAKGIKGQKGDVANPAATFSGDIIPDGSTLDQALQALETAVETKATAAGLASTLHLDDVRTALGVAEEGTNFGSFAGTLLTDNQDLKSLLQQLETAVELRSTINSTNTFAASQIFQGEHILRDKLSIDPDGGFHMELKRNSSTQCDLLLRNPPSGATLNINTVNSHGDDTLTLYSSKAWFRAHGGGTGDVQVDGTLTVGTTNVATTLTALQADIDQNESDADAAIALRAPIDNPVFTGIAKAPQLEVDNDGGYYYRFNRNGTTAFDILGRNIPSGGVLNINCSNNNNAQVQIHSELFWVRDLIGNGKARFDGDITMKLSSSVTPANDNHLMIEATNDTTLTFKYKGSDGTVRSGTITLS